MLESLIPFGFLPVIAYLATDAVAGRRKALWAALAVGAGELGYSLAGGAGPDPLGLTGFLLLAALVFASLRAEDDFYFRAHGALASVAAAAVMLAAWYAFDRALLLDIFARQVGLDKVAALDPGLPPYAVAEMLRVLSFQLPWWLLLHALFTLYAAVNWGKWGWAAVRIPGFLLALLLATKMAQDEVMKELAAEARSGGAPGKAAIAPVRPDSAKPGRPAPAPAATDTASSSADTVSPKAP